ncbi:MAG: hypothetical protein Q9167_003463 [Letrouitia subvulpina]
MVLSCLRALFPSASPSALSIASAFCATYTTKINTATTGFPTRATSACGSNPSSYSSACSCKPTYTSATTLSTTTSSRTTSSTTSSTSTKKTSTSTTSTSTTSTTPSCTPSPANNLIKNGGFECGLAPWVGADVVNTKHYVRGPGDASPNAYEFNQVGPVDDDSNMHPASVNQDITVIPGVEYVLHFRTYFDKCTGGEGFVGVMLNHEPEYTVDACDRYPSNVGAFGDNAITFTPDTSTENIRFEFLTGEPDAVIKIDNVVVLPAASQNVVQNAGFESGLAPWVATDTYNNMHYIRGPGDNSSNAYEFNQVGDPKTSQAGYVPASLSQNLPVLVGKLYLFQFHIYFDKCNAPGERSVDVSIGDVRWNFDACDNYAYIHDSVGRFGVRYGFFTTQTNPETLRFDFKITVPDAVVKLDNILVVPA